MLEPVRPSEAKNTSPFKSLTANHHSLAALLAFGLVTRNTRWKLPGTKNDAIDSIVATESSSIYTPVVRNNSSPSAMKNDRHDLPPRTLLTYRAQVLTTITDSWLRHSIAISHLARPWDVEPLSNDQLRCGPLAFAAVAGMRAKEALQFFKNDQCKLWTNRREMESTLRKVGWKYTRIQKGWPRYGLCCVHWRGPWSKHNYPAAISQHTHWVAVIQDYVFDVNWRGWLPKDNWEDVVVADLIRRNDNRVEGWEPLTAYEIGG